MFAVLGTMLLFGFFIFLISFLVVISFHILMAIGLYNIAKHDGNDKAFLAWFPVVNVILMAMIVDRDVHKPLRGKFAIIMGVVMALSILLSAKTMFISFLSFALVIYAFYFIAERYSKNVIANVVVAVLTLGIAMSIQLFRFRNRKPVYKVEFDEDGNIYG